MFVIGAMVVKVSEKSKRTMIAMFVALLLIVAVLILEELYLSCCAS